MGSVARGAAGLLLTPKARATLTGEDGITSGGRDGPPGRNPAECTDYGDGASSQRSRVTDSTAAREYFTGK